MKIDNKSIYHDNHVKKIINFVMPPLVKWFIDNKKMRVLVNIRTGNGATGQTECINKQWIVYLQVPSHYSKYPFQEISPLAEKNEERKNWVLTGGGTIDYVPAFILSREEHLVHCAAHELRHIAQHLAGVVVNAKDEHNIDILPPEMIKDIPPGKFSDKDADMYAIKKQREWRRLNTQDYYAQPDQIPVIEV
jgi:hypothetical protein